MRVVCVAVAVQFNKALSGWRGGSSADGDSPPLMAPNWQWRQCDQYRPRINNDGHGTQMPSQNLTHWWCPVRSHSDSASTHSVYSFSTCNFSVVCLSLSFALLPICFLLFLFVFQDFNPVGWWHHYYMIFASTQLLLQKCNWRLHYRTINAGSSFFCLKAMTADVFGFVPGSIMISSGWFVFNTMLRFFTLNIFVVVVVLLLQCCKCVIFYCVVKNKMIVTENKCNSGI